jgi:anti-sigma factor RsiW
MNCNEARIQLSGYVDGELSTMQSSHLDEHVSSCASCQRDRSVQSFVRSEMRREVIRYHAPAALQRRIREKIQAATEVSRKSWWSRLSWSMLTPVAGAAFAVLVGTNVVIYASLPSNDDRLADEVLTSHVRALVVSHAIDVVSSDRHTVKPWYTGKLDFSPPVGDFVAEGFKLEGGRLDYVDGRTVAALVYEHGGHMVDVFIWPSTGASSERALNVERRGYNLIHASHGGMTYWLASDLESTEVARLEELIAGTGSM